MRQLILSDLHIPYHDAAAISVAVSIGEDVKPDRIDLLGDIIDNRTLSTKFKSLPKQQRFETLEGELEPTREFLRRLRSRFPKAEIVYHEGNHEHRLQRWVDEYAPAIRGLISFGGLLGLDTLNIGHRPYGHLERVGSLRVTHGSIVRSKSGTSALGMLDKYGCNVLCGHTHRLSAVYETNGRATIGAWENGCLCRLAQHYTIGPNNWQQGFSIVEHHGKRFTVEQVPIIGGTAIYRGNVYAASEVKNPICKGIKQARI